MLTATGCFNRIRSVAGLFRPDRAHKNNSGSFQTDVT
jgi:hypothetical protein